MGGSPVYGHGPMGVTYPWPWAHGGSPTFGHGPMGGSPAYDHGPMGGHLPMAMAPWGVMYLWPWAHGPMGGSPAYGHGPMGGGHLSMAIGPWRSPTYDHGPMRGSPVYGHGPMGVTHPWPWAHGDWTPLLIKTVELSFGRNRCSVGPSAYGHAFSHISYGHAPIGGSPLYGHGPIGTGPHS